MEKAATSDRIFTTNFLYTCFASFGGFGSFYVLLATLPMYIQGLGANESEIGLVLMIFSITALIARPFAGTASDMSGKRTPMLIGIALMLASGILYQLAQTIPLIAGLRVLHGLGWGAFATASAALVADIIPPRRRGEAMGYYGVFGNVAMAAGPALGVFVASTVSFSAMFWMSAGVAAIGLISTIAAKEVAAPSKGPTLPLMSRLFHPRALFPAAILFCMALTYSSIISFLPLFAGKQQIGNPGLFFTVFAIVMIVARGPIGRLSDRFGRPAVIGPGLFVSAAAVTLLSTATSMPVFLLVAFLYACSFAAIQPSLMALTVDRVKPAERGSAMGTYSMAMDLGMGFGSLAWGYVIGLIGYQGMYLTSASMGLVGIAVLLTGTAGQRKRAEAGAN